MQTKPTCWNDRTIGASIASANAACPLLTVGSRARLPEALGANTSRDILLARARTVWPVNSHAAGMFAFSPSTFRTHEHTAPVCSDVPPACVQGRYLDGCLGKQSCGAKTFRLCSCHTAHGEAHTSNQLASIDTFSSAGNPKIWRQAARTASSIGFEGATYSTADVNWWRGRLLRSTCRKGA
jgi:hypothetical protein